MLLLVDSPLVSSPLALAKHVDGGKRPDGEPLWFGVWGLGFGVCSNSWDGRIAEMDGDSAVTHR
jgi:hypothetical protein